jgi:mono/diheme cytochrome c family protein
VAVLALVVVGVGALFAGAYLGERKMLRQVGVEVRPVALREDAAGMERGRYLFASRGCTECHGTAGGGKVVVEDGNGMLVKAPDITPGSKAVAGYQVVDWVRTIRHGLKRDGRPVIVMPSEDYARFTDEDLGALVAWLRAMPPAKGGEAVVRLPLMVKALYAAGVIRDAAEKIDHSLPPPAPVAEAPSREHGAYVANTCIGCHGTSFAGGRIPGAPPDWPPAADLRPGGPMKAYADARAFGAMLKTSKRPDGSSVSQVMPFGALKELNEVDVAALFEFLRSLQPAAR